MLTVLFASIGSFIEEISSSIIKFETENKKESIYSAGFITMLFGAIAFAGLAFFRGSFIFTAASLPFFLPRAVLEIVQIHFSMLATMKSDRSTFAFVRNLTIPLLLISDFFLGFTLQFNQFVGVLVILSILGIILYFHIINVKGIGYSLFSSINAVFTISLFKYDISHFNSVEAEQLVIYLVLIVYFFLASKYIAKVNPFLLLKRPLHLVQGTTHGIASILESFAIFFGNPGIAIAAKRASAVLAGIISGHNYFQEKKFGAKIIVSLVLVIGLILLAI